MNPIPCELIDGYLGKWLVEPERSAFEAHLADCPQCQRIVEEQERLQHLLIQATRRAAPVPPFLIRRLDWQLRDKPRRRMRPVLIGLAAAVVLIACGLAWMFSPWSAPDQLDVVQVADVPAPAPEQGNEPPIVRVTFANSTEIIAVPEKTTTPGITIIWVYPAIQSAQAADPVPAELPQSLERSGT